MDARRSFQVELPRIAATFPGIMYAFRMRPDGTVELPYVSPGSEALYDCSPEELMADAGIAFDLVHPDDAERFRASIEESRRTLEPWRCEFRVQHARRGEIWAEGHSIPEVEPGGSILWYGVIQDISDRKRSEQSLRQLADAVEHSAQGISIGCSRTNRILFCNPAFALMHRRTIDEMVGASIFDLYVESELATVRRSIVESERVGRAEYEALMKRADGSTFMVHLDLVSVRGADGTILYRVANIQDVTERHRTERLLATQAAVSQVLAESESLSDMIPKLLEAVCMTDRWELGVLWMVDDRNECLRCVEFWHESSFRGEALEPVVRAHASGRGVDLPGYVWASEKPALIANLEHAESCSLAPILLRAGLRSALGAPIAFGGKVLGIVGLFARDVHEPDDKLLDTFGAIGQQIGQFVERKRSEGALRRLIASGPAVIYALDVVDGAFDHVWTSDNLVDLTGYGPDEGVDSGWWRDGLHPDDRERVLAARKPPYEHDHQVLEFRFRCKDGGYIWIQDEKRLLRDEKGNPREVVGSWSNITERKQLESQLRQAQKMEAIGQLSSGIAHDFNNLLTIIQGQSWKLESANVDSPQLRACVDEIRQAAERAAILTRQLLMFSRSQELQLGDYDLNEIVSNVSTMLGRILGEDIHLQFRYVLDELPVRVDAGMMDQILLNLAVNARDAMPKGGSLLVETAKVEIDAKRAARGPQSRPGSFACMSVRDTGSGISEDVLPRIFEPFFTTKEAGKGTGLGLATVFGIVQQHNGWIDVQTEIDRGTTFRIHLPLIGNASREQRPVVAKPIVPRGNETILLVEDEASLRTLIQTILSNLGYRIVEASNGPEALVVWERHRGEVHLLLTDMVMPEGMSGMDLAKRLRVEAPELKVLYASGYSPELAGLCAAREGIDFLSKPFAPLKLAQTVRACLDQ